MRTTKAFLGKHDYFIKKIFYFYCGLITFVKAILKHSSMASTNDRSLKTQHINERNSFMKYPTFSTQGLFFFSSLFNRQSPGWLSSTKLKSLQIVKSKECTSNDRIRLEKNQENERLFLLTFSVLTTEEILKRATWNKFINKNNLTKRVYCKSRYVSIDLYWQWSYNITSVKRFDFQRRKSYEVASHGTLHEIFS